MSGWVISVRLSREEQRVLELAADRLKLSLPQLLAQGAAAYAQLCGFRGENGPTDVRVSPYWASYPRGPLDLTVAVPLSGQDCRRVQRACDYVRTVCGNMLAGVPLGEFIVGGTLRALRQWWAFSDLLAGLDLPSFNERVVFSRVTPSSWAAANREITNGGITR